VASTSGKATIKRQPVKTVPRKTPFAVHVRALGVAVFVTLGLVLVMNFAGPLLNALDHWSADLRTAYFTYQLSSQHKRVAFVVVNEESIAEAQKHSTNKYRSPIDRGLIARVIERLDGLGAKAIGIDILVDQASEPEKDSALMRAIRTAKTSIVLARLDFDEHRAQVEPEQREYHERFLAGAGRASGYVTARSELDGIVRAQATGGTGSYATFAEQLAKADGWVHSDPSGTLTVPSERIAWLQPPRDSSTTFLTLPASLLIVPPSELSPIETQLLKSLANRVVVVGVRFNDRTDRHRTPLNRSESDLMPGPEIHAQVVAQLLDGRSYLELTLPTQLALCILLAYVAALTTIRHGYADWLVGILPLLVYISVGVLLFWSLKLILPFAAPMLAWLGGVYVARFTGHREPKAQVVQTS
jgi:adenylate cyclase